MVLFFFEEKVKRPLRSALGSAQKANNVNGTLPFRAAAELARQDRSGALTGSGGEKMPFSCYFFRAFLLRS